MVKVTVAWSGLLPPIDGDGSSRFRSGCRSRLRFALTGASANICDLHAKLFVAPLDAAGQPGAERPAAGPAAGGGEPVLLHPDHQPVRDAARHPPARASGPGSSGSISVTARVHTERITLLKL